MSNKCFTTKYSSSVDNDNLMRLGEIKFTAVASDTVNGSLGIEFNTGTGTSAKPIKARLSSPVIYLGNEETEFTKTDGNNVEMIIPKGSTVDGYIRPKYNISKIDTNNLSDAGQLSSLNLNIDDLKYSKHLYYLIINRGNTIGDISSLSALTSLTYLGLSNTNVTGDISSLSALTSLTYLDLSNTNVTGDISSLSALTSLTYLGLSNTKFTGTIEDYVKTSRSAGRTTGKIKGVFNFGQVTFDGTRLVVSSGMYITVSWDATTITVSGTNNTALDKTITA